jgi:transcriptional regulator with XRE-family HTH domain
MIRSDLVSLADNARRLRREKRLSQDQVASRSGLSRSEISLIERGLRDPLSTTLVRLARALEVKPGRLLDGA